MPSKSKTNGWMVGQDVPYYPNNPKVQEYEQDQKRKKQFKIKMMRTDVGAETFAHKKAVEHHQRFCNFGLANKLHGMNANRLRLF